MPNKSFLSLMSLVFVLITPIMSYAEEDSMYVQMARDREYVGGLDESDLKVQSSLVPNENNKNLDNPESEEGF
ncbi:MAG: hypothetical protein A2622_11790 [Bdellovibrionales bacterium RIFCSPHIGHO2_01_FULL_40_29]|nr:MAG: hypothetical protein A2622_11790 [Bdellovibrionales bacterium RIFCSPHIGHO2_01_FULL_40_29]OFZ35288.1 MAG: hypothetical protein A3D17_08785 [Bdellovibrionales bacterium RIFCSPHIGHO2_02_FULL_40_15]